MIKDTITECMKSVHLHPLQYLAAVRVIITLCESQDVLHNLQEFSKNIDGHSEAVFSDCQWKKLRGKVKRKLQQKGIPDLIIDIPLEPLWPISFQIFKWIIYHDEDTGIECPSNFCWTPQIKIDYEKTAEILVKNEALDIKKRFKLACFYCLDSEVRSLWEEMSLSERRSFFSRGNLKKSNQNRIVLYWTYYIQEMSIDSWDSKELNQTQLLKYSVEKGYLSATKYFLGTLKVNMRKRMTTICLYVHLDKLNHPYFIVKDHLAIACFLLCQLPSEDFRTLYTLTLIFRYFLEWPMQKYFMTVVNRQGHLLSEINFGELLQGISEKIKRGFKDHDYKELFTQFWHQSSESSKTYARTEFGCVIFMEFAKKHFEFIFENNSDDIKAKFRAVVFQQEVSGNETHFEKENVEFFKFLVRESIISRSIIERIANRYRPFYKYFNMPMEELMNLIDGILGIV